MHRWMQHHSPLVTTALPTLRMGSESSRSRNKRDPSGLIGLYWIRFFTAKGRSKARGSLPTEGGGVAGAEPDPVERWTEICPASKRAPVGSRGGEGAGRRRCGGDGDAAWGGQEPGKGKWFWIGASCVLGWAGLGWTSTCGGGLRQQPN